MAIKPATPALLREMAAVILEGRMKTMLVAKNTLNTRGKGKIYAEYTAYDQAQESGRMGDFPMTRIEVAEILIEVATNMEAGREYTRLHMVKNDPEHDVYGFVISSENPNE